MKTNILFTTMILAVMLAGCASQAGTEDPLLTSDMKKLLDIDKDNEVQIVYLSKSDITENLETLNKACDDALEEKGYYKIRKRNIFDNTGTVYYIDPATDEIICEVGALIKKSNSDTEKTQQPAPTNNEKLAAESFPTNPNINEDKAKNLLMEYLKVDDDKLNSQKVNTLSDVDTGDRIDLTLQIYPRIEFENLKARLRLRDQEGNLYDEDMALFDDIEANDSSSERFSLKFPVNNIYKYYIDLEIFDEKDMILERKYEVEIEIVAPDVVIDYIDLSPSSEIDAGSILMMDVELENEGNADAEDLILRSSIEELDLYDNVEIENLADGADEEFKMYFRIPSDTEEDSYLVSVMLEDEDGKEIDSDTFRIDVNN